jgi:ADP-heptose:LPS heptosyltransferase
VRIVEIIRDFNHGIANYKAGTSLVMAEDVESQFRSLNGNCMGMSYPVEMKYKKYNGEDLTGKSILVWRTGGVGDICFLSSVFQYLKNKYKNCFIRVATGCRQPLENLPEVDELYDMPFDSKLLEISDLHIFFQGILESSSEKSKVTHAVDMFYSYFGIDSTQIDPSFKKPRLAFSEAEMKWLDTEVRALSLQPDDFVMGLQMETSAPLRNYPKEKLKIIVDIMAKEPKVKIVLIGSPQQAAVGGFLKGNNPNVIVATNYDVRKSIVLANRYNLILSPDSFMVQVAGALDKPLIGLYGPFPSEVRMKYFKNAIGMESKVVCSPCFQHDFRPCIKGHPSPCFSLLEPDDILQAIDYQRNKFYGSHFNFTAPFLKEPNFTEIEKYFLSADKGLCFFGGYYKHPNMVSVDANKFVGADITDFNHPFEYKSYPFVLYMNNIGYNNGAVYNNCKNFVRSGGYFIVYVDTCQDANFLDLSRDVGKSFTILYSKLDPVTRVGTIVGRKPF